MVRSHYGTGKVNSMPLQIDIPHDAIAAFCQRWRIKELSIFGSALRDDFRS